VVTVWPGAAPDRTPAAGPEQDTSKPGEGLIAGRPLIRLGNVSTPTLTLYPAVGTPTGAGVVVFPGGGYSILAIDLEGTEVCDWLTHRGIACLVLKYRVPNSGPYPKSPQALEDAQRALGLVRLHAAEWHIDPHRLGVLGFSAGAHLAAALSTHDAQRLYPAMDAADGLSCRPDFAFILYPGYLADESKGFAFSPDIPVTAETPPSFILQAEDDYQAHVENAVQYFMALKQVKVPAELHLYAEGGHGFGLRRTSLPITDWTDLADRWLKTIGMVK
jgi:acetyl esterase/lipase